MAGEPKGDSGDVASKVSGSGTETPMNKAKTKKSGFFSRIWNALFRSHGDDFEKRLQHISKEEATVLSRISRRSQQWRKITRNVILLSFLLELAAVGFAIMTTRAPDLNWKMRAWRVLPIFIVPGVSFLTFSVMNILYRMLDQKDQKTLENLRAERQAKIDELKEKTNYYITQQLIQRYDPDPAAKAAAATVLASKLGADSGLKVSVGPSKSPSPRGRSSDAEVVPSTGLRNRKQSHTRGSSIDGTVLHTHGAEMLHQVGFDDTDIPGNQQLVVEHHDPTGFVTNDGGWLSRIAALLVGEDPAQSFALICGNCHMHNGLAKKEDFPFVTYYCPHCKALNQPKQQHREQVSESNSPLNCSSASMSDAMAKNSNSSPVETAPCSTSPVVAVPKATEIEKLLSDATDS